MERFLDLLDPVDDDEVDDLFDRGVSRSAAGLPRGISSIEPSHGPLHWNTRCSVELQAVVDSFKKEELYELEFSVTLADPSSPDCPLVACSIGFTELTGYKVHEIVGRNCRFLLNGVPQNLISEETRLRCRSFCLSLGTGKEYDEKNEVMPQGLETKGWFNLAPKGELICVQTNATKTGELFRNMFYMKQVELDDAPYILALQAGLAEECGDDPATQILQKKCQAAWNHLDSNMAAIEQVLASQFWYQAPMRRQELSANFMSPFSRA